MSRWFRFDCDAVRHPKVVRLSDAEFRVWVEAISYAAEQGTDGRIARDWIRAARIPDQAVQSLLDAGLVEERGGDLWLHDYLDHQPPAERWTKASEAGRKAAQARWSKRQTPQATTPGTEPTTCETHSDADADGNAAGNATNTRTYTSKESPPTKKRNGGSSVPRDNEWREIYAALIHVVGGERPVTAAEKGKFAQAADQLRQAGASAGDVVSRGQEWGKHYTVPITPPALVRNWSTLAPKRRTEIGRFGQSRVIGGAA